MAELHWIGVTTDRDDDEFITTVAQIKAETITGQLE